MRITGAQQPFHILQRCLRKLSRRSWPGIAYPWQFRFQSRLCSPQSTFHLGRFPVFNGYRRNLFQIFHALYFLRPCLYFSNDLRSLGKKPFFNLHKVSVLGIADSRCFRELRKYVFDKFSNDNNGGRGSVPCAFVCFLATSLKV